MREHTSVTLPSLPFPSQPRLAIPPSIPLPSCLFSIFSFLPRSLPPLFHLLPFPFLPSLHPLTSQCLLLMVVLFADLFLRISSLLLDCGRLIDKSDSCSDSPKSSEEGSKEQQKGQPKEQQTEQLKENQTEQTSKDVDTGGGGGEGKKKAGEKAARAVQARSHNSERQVGGRQVGGRQVRVRQVGGRQPMPPLRPCLPSAHASPPPMPPFPPAQIIIFCPGTAFPYFEDSLTPLARQHVGKASPWTDFFGIHEGETAVLFLMHGTCPFLHARAAHMPASTLQVFFMLVDSSDEDTSGQPMDYFGIHEGETAVLAVVSHTEEGEHHETKHRLAGEPTLSNMQVRSPACVPGIHLCETLRDNGVPVRTLMCPAQPACSQPHAPPCPAKCLFGTQLTCPLSPFSPSSLPPCRAPLPNQEFITAFLAGELPPYYKSDPVPDQNDGVVRTVVGSTFKEIVMDDSKDVMLMVGARWCCWMWCGGAWEVTFAATQQWWAARTTSLRWRWLWPWVKDGDSGWVMVVLGEGWVGLPRECS
ncbi:unnamed protein product [Closterium sp. NIES-53]